MALSNRAWSLANYTRMDLVFEHAYNKPEPPKQQNDPSRPGLSTTTHLTHKNSLMCSKHNRHLKKNTIHELTWNY